MIFFLTSTFNFTRITVNYYFTIFYAYHNGNITIFFLQSYNTAMYNYLIQFFLSPSNLPHHTHLVELVELNMYCRCEWGISNSVMPEL